MRHRLLRWVDTAAHILHLPGRRWVCDRYDLSLGVTPDELYRTRAE
jgi:hypothetical protein